jgi:hypothetical protein
MGSYRNLSISIGGAGGRNFLERRGMCEDIRGHT